MCVHCHFHITLVFVFVLFDFFRFLFGGHIAQFLFVCFSRPQRNGKDSSREKREGKRPSVYIYIQDAMRSAIPEALLKIKNVAHKSAAAVLPGETRGKKEKVDDEEAQ